MTALVKPQSLLFQVSGWHNGSGSFGIRVRRRDGEWCGLAPGRAVTVSLEDGPTFRVAPTDSFETGCYELRDTRETHAFKEWFVAHRLADPAAERPWPLRRPPRFNVVWRIDHLHVALPEGRKP